MRTSTQLTLLCLLLAGNLLAQEPYKCARATNANKAAWKTTVANPDEDKYDVKYVKLNVALDNTSINISGDVTTKAQVTATGFNTYVFELHSGLTIDSVFINGARTTSISRGISDVSVSIGSTLPINSLFTAQVYYHGYSAGTGMLYGITSDTGYYWQNRATHTLSESYKAYEWWPCKQSLRDKIDSADIWITVPDTLKAGSNGVLQRITSLSGGLKRYEWKEKYPMVYYLISLAVGDYLEYNTYAHYTGSTDSTLIQNYLYNDSSCFTTVRDAVDATGPMMTYFSDILGRYPFWQEKYGHCMAHIGGAMEHQTMTTIGYMDLHIIAHELGHQWFGDHVTCGTWRDIFINESFATYTDYLYTEHFEGRINALTFMNNTHNYIKTSPGGIVYCIDTTEATIFDSRLSYNKGAAVIHMLRNVIHDDSLFFQLCRTVQSRYSMSNATIEDFKQTINTTLGTTINGIVIDTFIDQWLYKEGFPIYAVSWNQSSTTQRVFFQLNQTTSMPSSVALFKTPVEVTFYAATGDTTVRFLNDQAIQTFSFDWNKTVTSIQVEPNQWLLHQLGTIRRDRTLQVATLGEGAFTIAPNPTADSWLITGISEPTNCYVYNMNGQLVWQQTTQEPSLDIPAGNWASGMYTLTLVGASGVQHQTLVKQ